MPKRTLTSAPTEQKGSSSKRRRVKAPETNPHGAGNEAGENNTFSVRKIDPIYHLDHDVLNIIISHLPVAEIVRFEGVSHVWKIFIKSSITRFGTIDIFQPIWDPEGLARIPKALSYDEFKEQACRVHHTQTGRMSSGLKTIETPAFHVGREYVASMVYSRTESKILWHRDLDVPGNNITGPKTPIIPYQLGKSTVYTATWCLTQRYVLEAYDFRTGVHIYESPVLAQNWHLTSDPSEPFMSKRRSTEADIWIQGIDIIQGSTGMPLYTIDLPHCHLTQIFSDSKTSQLVVVNELDDSSTLLRAFTLRRYTYTPGSDFRLLHTDVLLVGYDGPLEVPNSRPPPRPPIAIDPFQMTAIILGRDFTHFRGVKRQTISTSRLVQPVGEEEDILYCYAQDKHDETVKKEVTELPTHVFGENALASQVKEYHEQFNFEHWANILQHVLKLSGPALADIMDKYNKPDALGASYKSFNAFSHLAAKAWKPQSLD
ncbi:hypothetical protein BJX70DRAFT_394598 [Aspergillus crustosus]